MSGERTTLILARHGETVWHPDNRYAGGSSDIDLTPRGELQAKALARWCLTDPPDAVISSPVRRARETATPSAQALGTELEIVDALREVDFGLAEGRTIEELATIDADMVARFRADPQAHPFPGAEQPQLAADRAAAALRGIAAAHAGGRVLVVAHNTLLRLALCVLLDLPVARYRQVFPRLDNAAVSELSIGPDDLAGLLSLNVRLPM
jgi:2,3-bisphosphoglycerate-dependent phosphoglycerate mutase